MNIAAQTRARRTRTLRSLLGLLCIVLVLFAGGMNLLHTHGVGSADVATDPACSLCALTHVAALPGAVALAPVSVEAVFFAPPPAKTVPPSRFFSFSSYVRPPPFEAPRS